jgi:putative transposase
VLLRIAYLGVTNVFAVLRLLPSSDRDKDVEILALRHQITVLQRSWAPRRCGWTGLTGRSGRPYYTGRHATCCVGCGCWCSRTLSCAGTATCSPAATRPDPGPSAQAGRARCVPYGSSCCAWPGKIPAGATGACMANCWRLGVKVAASTVWEIMKDAGIDPAPDRAASTWADLPRSQANALLACDFLETVTLTGTRMYVLAVIEHASRRIRIPGATPHPTTAWVAQAARNLVIDIEDTGRRALRVPTMASALVASL